MTTWEHQTVLNDSPDRDQKIRRVVEGPTIDSNEFSEKINVLSEQIVEKAPEIKKLRDEKAQIAGDNDALPMSSRRAEAGKHCAS